MRGPLLSYWSETHASCARFVTESNAEFPYNGACEWFRAFHTLETIRISDL
jgi:hypothetical protein